MWVNILTYSSPSPSPSPSHHHIFVSIRYRKCCGGHGSFSVMRSRFPKQEHILSTGPTVHSIVQFFFKSIIKYNFGGDDLFWVGCFLGGGGFFGGGFFWGGFFFWGGGIFFFFLGGGVFWEVGFFCLQYSTVQYSTVQYNTEYSTVQYSTVQYNTEYSTVQYTLTGHLCIPKVVGCRKREGGETFHLNAHAPLGGDCG